jgi:MFS family permease
VKIPARVVAVLGALSAFGPISIDFYLPGLPQLTSDFDAPASAGQLTLTACLLGLALGQLVFGPLTDRFGRRPPLLAGLAGILPCLFVSVGSIGLVIPNATALALTDYPHAAGRASALLGMLQFTFGALAAPLVGVAGSDTAVPMALLMAAFGVGALTLLLLASARLRLAAPQAEPAADVTVV